MGWSIVHEEQEDGVSGHKVRAENRDKIQIIKDLARKGKFDILLVTKQYHSTIARARELYNVKKIILSGDIFDDNVPALEEECQQQRLPYHSIKSSGAYVNIE